MAKRAVPEVNAGSMADIAFLLLIFFLVTTTIDTDAGLDRKLPPIVPPENPPVIRQKNIFTVVVNKNNQLLVEDKLMNLKDVRQAAIDFLDNGAGTGEDACSYCKGNRDPESSDNPDKAIISLQNDRETKYSTYIAVQNELVAAYNELRSRYTKEKFNIDYRELEAEAINPKTSASRLEEITPVLEEIKAKYPQKLSEAEPKSN